MFQSVPSVPPDPIFSLFDQFRADSNPNKINLTVGTYQNEAGETPVMRCVKLAEAELLKTETTKNYLGIAGSGDYNLAAARLLLGEDSPARQDRRYVTIQTPGGTGALRIAAEFLDQQRADNVLWIGDPTWSNHLNIFGQANVATRHYHYLDSSKTRLHFDGLVEALGEAAPGDAFLFHACCHNPSGIDLEPDQWEIVFGFMRERNLLPIFDCAYQGFHESIDGDVFPLRRLAELGAEFLICSSNSKNFGLYGERVGAITAVTESPEQAQRMDGFLQSIIRAIYSNPPKHGAVIVTTVLQHDELRKLWQDELVEIRGRIRDMRERLASNLQQLTGDHRFEFLTEQHGMFGFSGLTADQVDLLRERHAIYALRSGRINVAGVNPANVERVAQAICDVLAGAPAAH